MISFEVFTNRVHSCLSISQTPQECADHVAVHLKALINNPGFLADVHRQSNPDEPRANLVYVSPEGLFSVVAFVWQPDQATCIHDHVCWCVVGVLEGEEEETNYQLMADAEQQWLEPLATRKIPQGHVCRLVPPGQDIHQVRNVGEQTAISIHVYGTDIAKRGTSINHRFDHLAVLEDRPGQAVNWREYDLGVETGLQLGSQPSK